MERRCSGRAWRLAAVITALVFPAAAAWAGNSQCGPFGDPPAPVDRGVFASVVSDNAPLCWGGELIGPWRDAGGDDRYACLYEPESADASGPLPLIIFLHPAGFVSSDVVRLTGLPDLVESADLGGGRPGVILLAPAGRYTRHYYPWPARRTLGWDNWYRQLSPSGDVTRDGVVYPENADAAAIDHFVDQEIATGKVDEERIYVVGWSNGAAMAILYALNRPRVAAAAVYSAPDPFGAFDDPCPQTPVSYASTDWRHNRIFNTHVEVMHIHNACDIEGICLNGEQLKTELLSVGVECEDVILDFSRRRVGGCDRSCGTDFRARSPISPIAHLMGFVNHVRWPSTWTPRMIDFLRLHPLSSGKALRDGGTSRPDRSSSRAHK